MEIGAAQLGFVVCATMPDGSFLGGVLVTDALGLPVEFRHSDNVTPTRLQRVLYGRVLDRYMYSEVIVGALLGAVENLPRLYLVADSLYLEGAACFGRPAVWISEARNVAGKEIGARQDISAEEYVIHLGPGNGPVRVRMQATAETPIADLRASSAALLAESSQTMELVEPLRRVEQALQLVWEDQQPKQARAA